MVTCCAARKADRYVQVNSTDSGHHEEAHIDRRRRHANDPTMPVTVYIPDALQTELEQVTKEMGWTRSGAIVAAIREWLARQEDAPGE
jgi:hypothetical protein